MFAIIETGGKQYKVNEGSKIKVEKLPEDTGALLNLKPIFVYDNNNNLVNDDLTSFLVHAKIVRNAKAKKLTIFTYKNKTNAHRRLGHRQCYTELLIEKIGREEAGS
jgi:large subunit ribosomal protein L21